MILHGHLRRLEEGLRGCILVSHRWVLLGTKRVLRVMRTVHLRLLILRAKVLAVLEAGRQDRRVTVRIGRLIVLEALERGALASLIGVSLVSERLRVERP